MGTNSWIPMAACTPLFRFGSTVDCLPHGAEVHQLRPDLNHHLIARCIDLAQHHRNIGGRKVRRVRVRLAQRARLHNDEVHGDLDVDVRAVVQREAVRRDGAQYRMVLLSFAYPSMAQRLVEYLSGLTDGNGLQPEDYTDLRSGMPLSSFLLCEANMCARRGLGCLSPRASFTEYASSRVGAATNGSATTFGASTVYVTPPPPPPDLVPVLASTLTILALLIVGAILAALIIRRVFYTRTTKRWDDDYVMMNTKVLTVPLFDPMNAGAFEEEEEGGRGFDGAKRRHMTHHNSNNEEEEDEDDLELLGISPRGAGASSSAAPPRDVFGFEDTLMSPRKLRERRRQMGHDDDDDNDNDHRRVPANEDDEDEDNNDRGGRRRNQERSNRSLSHSNKKKNRKPSGRPPQRSGGGGDGSGIDAFDLGALY